MLNLFRVTILTALWSASLALLVARTVFNENMALGILSAWSLWVGMLALAVTGWHVLGVLLVRERARVESIAEHAADVAIRQAGLDSIGPA